MNSPTPVDGTSTSRSSWATSTQRFVLASTGASPYVWRGLLPTLGLLGTMGFALGPFATNDIEAQVRSEVRGQLQAKDHGWVNLLVSGQEVLLSGTPPRADSGEEALAIARATTCPTWSGQRLCPVTVIDAFGAAPGMPAAPALPSAPASVAPAAQTASPAPAVAAPAAVACEAAFAKLLETSRIEFDSGGSTIDARSAVLLDKLALTARGCPGGVLIVGHTDNVGEAQNNQRLSEARAAAVREALLQRGLPATRLQTAGFGETRPLADNESAAGRAANRRIDFKAMP